MREQAAPPSSEAVRPATFVEAERLSAKLGCDVTLAVESFQHTGSFKFRAAYEVAARVPQRKLLTASSGNFGAALARACRLLGKSCLVVMPATSARVKIDAVRGYGGAVDLVDVTTKSRAARVQELAREHPDAYVASAYDDPLVIAGNASLGREIACSGRGFEIVVAPVGGGGLTSGIVTGIRESGASIAVWGAEPLEGNDAARSLAAGTLLSNQTEPRTIADGARTVSLGQNNWAILREGLAGIVEVPEEMIIDGVRLLFLLANLKAEPTGALPVGAVRTSPERFAGRRVCCVVSGGNVDPGTYRRILEGI
jgi:threonine dehydratase